jgi:hypothetical protein
MEMTEQTDRKYHVFVSSTFRDLGEARKQAIAGISDARHIPIALDRFVPESASDLEVIRREIEASQVYLMILGARYGESPRGERKSYVELEYEMAEKAKCHFLIFGLDSRDVQMRREKMRRSKHEADRAEASDARTKKLDRLYAHARKHYWKPWNFDDLESIRRETALALQGLPSKEGAPLGYIREMGEFKAEDLVRVYSSSEIVREIFVKLNTFAELDQKLGIMPEEKKALAEAFVRQHGGDVARKYSSIFLESGSTVAMIARELSARLAERPPGFELRTNNAFAFMFLWLCKQISCVSAPPGPPDAVYAGTYGGLTDRARLPNYACPPLAQTDPEAAQIVEHMATKDIFSRPDGHELVLAAASGLQVSDAFETHEEAIGSDSPQPFSDPVVLSDMKRHCRGFHVGSYYNKLFKRCLYATKAPTIVFIHDEKIDCPIVVPKCHFICDQAYTWDEMMKSYPLSIWVVSTRKSAALKRDHLSRHMQDGGWEFSIDTPASKYPVIIGHNEAFRERAQAIGVYPQRAG